MSPSRPRPPEGDAGGGPGFDRDLVSLYSRFTRTLEDLCSRPGGCGRDGLARRLSELRREAADAAKAKAALHAVARCFRRMELLPAGNAVPESVREFAARMAESVSRPEPHVLSLLGMFCCGDDALSLRPVCGNVPACQSCQLTRDCEYYNRPRKPEMTTLTPAQRLWAENDKALSDAELLAVILFGEKGTGAEALVETLLARYGRLRALFRADANGFMTIRGMQKPQALRLAAFTVLRNRLLEEEREERLLISSSRDIYDRYAPELRDYQVEVAVLLLLDAQNRVIRDKWIYGESVGTARAEVAGLLRSALRGYASRVALVHNHPSGESSPSMDDLNFTRRLRQACDTVGMALVDHVIVGERDFFSFADNGMLQG